MAIWQLPLDNQLANDNSVRAMTDPHTLIAEINAYCRSAGQQASTVCGNALGNPRYLARLMARMARLDEEAKRLRSYMAANPVEGGKT